MYKQAGNFLRSAYRELLRRATTNDVERYQAFVALRAFGRTREAAARHADAPTSKWQEDNPPVMCIPCT